MDDLRITSVSDPFASPQLLGPALTLLRRASGAGLLPEAAGPIERLDLELIQGIAREAAEAGVGQSAAAGLVGHGVGQGRLLELMEQLEDAITESPLPLREIGELAKIYGIDAVADFVGASAGSLRRYLTGVRMAPDDVAGRAHFVALVSGDLAGSYNAIGLRRWWDRARPSLGGVSPRTALGTGWQPDDPAARKVAELAASLAGAGAAT